jgi:N-acyl-L-homoserine lactone synthetase
MKLKQASQEYLDKAAALTKEEAERMFARMHGKLARKFEREKIPSLEAVALQLQIEDEELREWRQRWAELEQREAVRARKSD